MISKEVFFFEHVGVPQFVVPLPYCRPGESSDRMLVPHGTRSRLLFLLLNLLGLLVWFIHLNFLSSQALGSDSPKKPTIRRSNDVPNCGFVGDSDIYSIGIRLGYYTQAVSLWFANTFVVGQAPILRSVNGLFFALSIGLIWLSRDPYNIFAIEAWLLVQLLTATWVIGVLDLSQGLVGNTKGLILCE